MITPFIFVLKLAAWNLIHTIIMGAVGFVAGLIMLALTASSTKGEDDVKTPAVLVMVTNLITLPLALLMPYVSAQAVKLSLAADAARMDWLWWVIGLMGGIQPWAMAATRGKLDANPAWDLFWVWACRIGFGVAAFLPAPEWLWLRRVVEAVAVK